MVHFSRVFSLGHCDRWISWLLDVDCNRVSYVVQERGNLLYSGRRCAKRSENAQNKLKMAHSEAHVMSRRKAGSRRHAGRSYIPDDENLKAGKKKKKNQGSSNKPRSSGLFFKFLHLNFHFFIYRDNNVKFVHVAIVQIGKKRIEAPCVFPLPLSVYCLGVHLYSVTVLSKTTEPMSYEDT